ncbi:uncharacterized protein LOC125546926 [Triticum urartu]|uniref:uncharacterized protein LOC125546926 n=1 Tax=Triticum urartu TaxID=4572 RepID=UPI0020441DF6|nr:uncharacterized protein LOC125546926 [Triticum urartu]
MQCHVGWLAAVLVRWQGLHEDLHATTHPIESIRDTVVAGPVNLERRQKIPLVVGTDTTTGSPLSLSSGSEPPEAHDLRDARSGAAPAADRWPTPVIGAHCTTGLPQLPLSFARPSYSLYAAREGSRSPLDQSHRRPVRCRAGRRQMADGGVRSILHHREVATEQ